jgi:hypothetical protein
MEVSSLLQALTALTLEKDSPVPIRQKAGWFSKPVLEWRRRKIPFQAGI